MGKTSNPVDAHRKALRAKELKKNKQNKQKAKEITTVKKDTRPLEQEIRKLSSKGNLSKQDRDELARLKDEVSYINKAKSDYVESHPEHRKYVFPERATDQSEGQASDEPAGLYDKNGRLKHPERSIYFDPVFNPFGAPPPGMPYREKPEYTMQRLGIPTPEELAAFNPIAPEGDSDDDDEESGSEDEDIAMPSGPPPDGANGSDDSDSDSDDDIPMPAGPPPPKASAANPSSRVHIPRPSRANQSHPNPHFRPPHPHQNPHALPPRPAFVPPTPSLPPPANAPTGPRNPHQLPSRPPPPSQHMSDPMSLGDSQPQRAFQSIGPQFPSNSSSSAATISSAPSPFLPIGGNPSASSSSASASTATISAAPQLRDLKKEATAFLPAAMRKKQQQQKAKLERVGLSKVDASRGGDSNHRGGNDGEEVGVSIEKGPSLMESLKAKGVGAGGLSGSLPPPKKREDEDYRKFEENMKEFL